MGKLVKIIAGILGTVVALIVLLVVAAVVLTSVYQDDIRSFAEQQVKEKTGRELDIGGDIKVSLFPWVGIELGAVSFGNAPGFGPEPFASIEQADVRLKLMPLFSKQVQADTVVLRGLSLSLGRNAEGVSNWDDLVKPGEQEEEAKVETGGPGIGETLAALNIGGVDISDAHVIWDDRQASQRFEVQDFDLSVGALVLNAPMPISIAFQIDSTNPDLHGRIELISQAILDPDGQVYRLDGTTLLADLKSQLIPGGKLDARLSADIMADLNKQQARLDKLQLDALGARMEGNVAAERILDMPDVAGSVNLSIADAARLKGALGEMVPLQAGDLGKVSVNTSFSASLSEQTADLSQLKVAALGVVLEGKARGSKIIDAPAISGQLKSNEFVPGDVAARLGVTLPEMADPSALTKATLSLNFDAGLDSAALSNLQVKFDDSTLSGKASVARFSKPVIRYDLTLDGIDADRYLPPPAPPGEQPAVTPATAAAAGATELPLDALRGLDVDGTVRVGKLKVMNLHSDSLLATLKGKDGLFRVYPVSANLYEGSYAGNLTFDVRNDTPQMAMDEKLTGVQAGPLLKDFMGKDHVTGKANLSAKLTAAGLEPMAVRKSLNGNAAFLFENGAVNGINIAQLIRNAYSAYSKEPVPKDEVKQTDFAELKGSLTIKNGLVSNNDLSAKSPLFRITGEGTADLVSEKLDYLVNAAIVGSLEGQGGKEIADLKGLTVPVRISGTFSDPGFNVELGKLLEAKAKAAIDAKKKEAEERLKKQVEEKKQDLKKDLEEQLRDKLKFKF